MFVREDVYVGILTKKGRVVEERGRVNNLHHSKYLVVILLPVHVREKQEY